MTADGRQVAHGAVAYLCRYVAVTGLSFAANLLLLRFLQPAEFGVLAVLNLGLSLLTICSEGGLNVYLVQRSGEVDPVLMARMFLVQMFASAGLQVALSFVLLAVWAGGFDWHLPLYIWCVAFAMSPSLIRGGRVMLLERRLQFTSIALVEGVEAVVYSGAAVALAWVGCGVWAVVMATLARSLIGLVLTLRLVPVAYQWTMPRWDKDLRAGFNFGVHYHASSLLSIARGLANPLLVGNALGLAAVGLCDRSAFVAGIPLLMVGAVQARVLFPYFARIQSDNTRTRLAFERSLYLSGVLDKAIFVPLVLFAPCLPLLLGNKWAPAVPVIEIMAWGNLIFGSYMSSATPLLSAVGRIHWVAYISVVTTVALWTLCWPAVRLFGVAGFAYLSLLNWMPVIWLAYRIQNEWRVDRLGRIWGLPVATGFVAIVVTYGLFRPFPQSTGYFLAKSLSGVLIYAILLWLLDAARLAHESRLLIRSVLPRAPAPNDT